MISKIKTKDFHSNWDSFSVKIKVISKKKKKVFTHVETVFLSSARNSLVSKLARTTWTCPRFWRKIAQIIQNCPKFWLLKFWHQPGGPVPPGLPTSYAYGVNEPLFSNPTRGLISGLVPYYRLPYSPKFSCWSSSCIPWRYLPARIIIILYHYGHELNSQTFLTIYFCTRLFCDKKLCINIFCVTNFAHLFRRVFFLCYQK